MRACIQRRASDTHQQVGPGQTFPIKWATGHAADTSSTCLHPIKSQSDPKCIPIGRSYTSITIVRGEDAGWLEHPDFEKMVEEYVVDAPSSSHLDPHWARYHGVPETTCGNCDGLGEDKGGESGFLAFAKMTEPPDPPFGSPAHTPGSAAFSVTKEETEGLDSTRVPILPSATTAEVDQRYLQLIEEESVDYVDHTFAKTRSLYRYAKSALENDRRVQYRNEKHPWLLFAGVYPHMLTRPSDYDTIRIDMPTTHGDAALPPGHYIVHYRWKGYSDCTDVNVHASQMDNVDGVDEDRYIWNRIDHCQYDEPDKVMSACRVSNQGPGRCVAELTKNRHEFGCGTQCLNRWGVNVVPLQNPPAVLHQGEVNIPWMDGTCSNTDLTTVAHKNVSRSESIDWGAWDVEEVAGHACGKVLWTKRLTLRQAVLDCTRHDCLGLSAELRRPSEDPVATTRGGGNTSLAALTGGLEWQLILAHDIGSSDGGSFFPGGTSSTAFRTTLNFNPASPGDALYSSIGMVDEAAASVLSSGAAPG